jgi:hypothetical protein
LREVKFLNWRCPYHAKVMKMLERMSKDIV